MSEPRPQPSQPELVLSPHYHSAVNAITQPDRMVFVSGYLVERWLPELGGDGLAILVFLRKKCYYNRRTGEKRDKVTVSLSDIARGCAISVNTVRRQMQNNMALQNLCLLAGRIRLRGEAGWGDPDRQYLHGQHGRPLHPADLPRLAEEMQRREADWRSRGPENARPADSGATAAESPLFLPQRPPKMGERCPVLRPPKMGGRYGRNNGLPFWEGNL